MPLSYRILPHRGLVYVRYEGFARAAESARVFAEYAADPDCQPGQKQLIDLSAVTGFDHDFPTLIELQAQKVDAFVRGAAETLLVYYAPQKVAYDMTRLVLRSWEGVDAVVALVQQDEAEALALLGQPERSMVELLEAAG